MERLANYILDLYPLDRVPLKRRMTLHGIFWGIFFIFLWLGVGIPSDTLVYKFLGAASYTLTSSTFFYLSVYLIPHLHSKYTGFTRVVILILLIVTFCFFLASETYIRVTIVIENNWLSDKKSRMYEIYHNAYKAGFWAYFQIDNLITDTIQLIIIALPAFFMKFIRTFSRVLSEKKQLEIDFLRLQINPHFLVNTLNNIYSLVVIGDQRSGNAVLSLSNLMGYVLYESASPTVAIEKEIEFLQGFVALEQIRNSKVDVKMNSEGELKGEIAPLILIAFIENAFKHGAGDTTIQSYVHINIKVENNTLFLGVINSKARKTSEKHRKSLGGIGLINVKRRLNSSYPNRHNLQVISESNKHQIILVIILT